jgi:hypothetical protein
MVCLAVWVAMAAGFLLGQAAKAVKGVATKVRAANPRVSKKTLFCTTRFVVLPEATEFTISISFSLILLHLGQYFHPHLGEWMLKSKINIR